MLGKNEGDTPRASFSDCAGGAQDPQSDTKRDAGRPTAFDRYAETARLYIKDLRSADEAPPRLAMKIKELGLLWDEV